MKLKITNYEIQIELFHETESSSVPVHLPSEEAEHLPSDEADRKAELKRAIAELLLSVALADAARPRGGQRDE
jgi:hypothetical protein